jgi:hypothetical protein
MPLGLWGHVIASVDIASRKINNAVTFPAHKFLCRNA